MDYSIQIKEFAYEKTSKKAWLAFYEFYIKSGYEMVIKPPFIDINTFKSYTMRKDERSIHFRWVVCLLDNQNTIIGIARLSISHPGSYDFNENKFVAGGTIRVLKDYQGQGVGKKLAEKVFLKAKNYGIRTIQANAQDMRSFKFAEKLGGQVYLDEMIYELDLKQIDLNLLDSWIEEGKTRCTKSSLEFYKVYPVGELDKVADLLNEIYSYVPLGKIESKHVFTADSLKIDQQMMNKGKLKSLVALTRELDGEFSGITRIDFYDLNNISEAEQNITGVRKQYQNRGLGKWLKAALIKYLMEEKQSIKKIITVISHVNDPMKSINNRLGFIHLYTEKSYKFSIE